MGHPDMVEFQKRTGCADWFPEFETIVREGLGEDGPDVLHGTFDHGAVIRKATDRDRPRNGPARHGQSAHHAANGKARSGRRVLCSRHGTSSTNALTASTFPTTGWPVFWLPYRNSDALAVARDLDKKVETLLSEAAG